MSVQGTASAIALLTHATSRSLKAIAMNNAKLNLMNEL